MTSEDAQSGYGEVDKNAKLSGSNAIIDYEEDFEFDPELLNEVALLDLELLVVCDDSMHLVFLEMKSDLESMHIACCTETDISDSENMTIAAVAVVVVTKSLLGDKLALQNLSRSHAEGATLIALRARDCDAEIQDDLRNAFKNIPTEVLGQLDEDNVSLEELREAFRALGEAKEVLFKVVNGQVKSMQNRLLKVLVQGATQDYLQHQECPAASNFDPDHVSEDDDFDDEQNPDVIVFHGSFSSIERGTSVLLDDFMHERVVTSWLSWHESDDESDDESDNESQDLECHHFSGPVSKSRLQALNVSSQSSASAMRAQDSPGKHNHDDEDENDDDSDDGERGNEEHKHVVCVVTGREFLQDDEAMQSLLDHVGEFQNEILRIVLINEPGHRLSGSKLRDQFRGECSSKVQKLFGKAMTVDWDLHAVGDDRIDYVHKASFMIESGFPHSTFREDSLNSSQSSPFALISRFRHSVSRLRSVRRAKVPVC